MRQAYDYWQDQPGSYRSTGAQASVLLLHAAAHAARAPASGFFPFGRGDYSSSSARNRGGWGGAMLRPHGGHTTRHTHPLGFTCAASAAAIPPAHPVWRTFATHISPPRHGVRHVTRMFHWAGRGASWRLPPCRTPLAGRAAGDGAAGLAGGHNFVCLRIANPYRLPFAAPRRLTVQHWRDWR